MPLFLIERRFVDAIEPNAEVAAHLKPINEEAGVRWLYSFLAADNRKTYCIYEAPDAAALVEAAHRAGLPADVIVEVSDRLEADGSLSPIE